MRSCMIDNLNRDVVLIVCKYIYDYNIKNINKQIKRLISQPIFLDGDYSLIMDSTGTQYAINDRDNGRLVINNINRADPVIYIRHYVVKSDFALKTVTQHKIPANYW